MHVKQHLSILFYLKRRKAGKGDMIPIYVRITIDGLEAEISLGCNILAEQWDDAITEVPTAVLALEVQRGHTGPARCVVSYHRCIFAFGHLIKSGISGLSIRK
jgi:hypothetical protein